MPWQTRPSRQAADCRASLGTRARVAYRIMGRDDDAVVPLLAAATNARGYGTREGHDVEPRGCLPSLRGWAAAAASCATSAVWQKRGDVLP